MSQVAPWMEVAWGELGVSERPGPADNPRILDYHRATTLKATDDAVPWCSAFVCWVMQEAGVGSLRNAAARSWLGWGRAVADGVPYGSIVVLTRGDPAGWQGHVGLAIDAGATTVWVLSGNDDNAVRVRGFARGRILGVRWPHGPVGGRR